MFPCVLNACEGSPRTKNRMPQARNRSSAPGDVFAWRYYSPQVSRPHTLFLFEVTSVPKRPGGPIGPATTVVPGVLDRVSKDGRAKRPNLDKTAILGVDGRALQSLVRVLPVVICRAL